MGAFGSHALVGGAYAGVKFERAEDELQALKRSRMVRAAHRTSRQVQAMRISVAGSGSLTAPNLF